MDLSQSASKSATAQPMRARVRHQRAFSLVELSIVLAILGLLIGGVLAGQSLIRAAQLRSVTTDYSRYLAAANNFRDQYSAIPGDMPNATAYWGKDDTNCAGNTGEIRTPGTCNGNGDKILDGASAANSTGENYRAWQQLALAGYIEGSFSGQSGSGAAFHAVAGTNVPKSRITKAAWGLQGIAGTYAGDTAAYSYKYGNTFQFGAEISNSWPLGPVLKPDEVFNIDTKLDDGKPGSGTIIPYYWSTCTTSTSNTGYDGVYRLNDNTNQCAMYFVRAF